MKPFVVAAAIAGCSIWIGLEVGFDRDPLLAALFLFGLPGGVVAACIALLRARRRRTNSTPEKENRA